MFVSRTEGDKRRRGLHVDLYIFIPCCYYTDRPVTHLTSMLSDEIQLVIARSTRRLEAQT